MLRSMTTAQDDERLGLMLRRLRRELNLTQRELAIASDISLFDLRRVESGAAGEVPFGRIRRLFTQCDARARVSVWWKGAALDRLLDQDHAAIVEHGSALIARYGFLTPTEVTFSEYGERGSVDIFAHREELKAVAVCEAKSAFGSLEELNRTLDAKARLAPRICEDRYGWRPRCIARLLLVPSVSSTRRVVAAHRTTLDQLYPARATEIRRWLRHPNERLGGIWFLSNHRNPDIDSDPAR